MPYDFIGCMEQNAENDDKWRPAWENPCSGELMPGCMDPSGQQETWVPKLEDTDVGGCNIDESGCMQQAGGDGKWQPVITLDDYVDADDFKESCCADCDHCFDEFQAPQFISITFDNIAACPDRDIGSVNNTYVLEWNDLGTPTVCRWYLNEGTEIGDVEIIVGFIIVGATLRLDIQFWKRVDFFGSARRTVYGHFQQEFACLEEGPFEEAGALGPCGFQVWGEDGVANINWDI